MPSCIAWENAPRTSCIRESPEASVLPVELVPDDWIAVPVITRATKPSVRCTSHLVSTADPVPVEGRSCPGAGGVRGPGLVTVEPERLTGPVAFRAAKHPLTPVVKDTLVSEVVDVPAMLEVRGADPWLWPQRPPPELGTDNCSRRSSRILWKPLMRAP